MVNHEHTDPDDPALRRLVEELQAGRNREENSRRIFHRYYPPLKTFFARRGVSPDERHDLIQETFINAFQGLGNFQHDAKFDTWLYKVAGNVWKNVLRRRATQKRDAAEVPLEPELTVTSGSDPEQEALRQERERLEMQALRRELEKLPPRMRQCLLLRLNQKRKYREIADSLGIAINTVKSLLHEAKKRLRDNLGDSFPDRPDEERSKEPWT